MPRTLFAAGRIPSRNAQAIATLIAQVDTFERELAALRQRPETDRVINLQDIVRRQLEIARRQLNVALALRRQSATLSAVDAP